MQTDNISPQFPLYSTLLLTAGFYFLKVCQFLACNDIDINMTLDSGTTLWNLLKCFRAVVPLQVDLGVQPVIISLDEICKVDLSVTKTKPDKNIE